MICSKLMSLSIAGALALGGCTFTDWRDSLSDADRVQSHMAVQSALETRKTGESGNWANPASGHRGTVTPTRSWRANDGRDCRDYQQTPTVGDVTRVGYGSACRAGDGVWVDRRSPRYVVAGTEPYRYDPDRLYYGFGHDHYFAYPYDRYGHHDLFGPYPLHTYGYRYPYYWY